jgi:hypothetical protein
MTFPAAYIPRTPATVAMFGLVNGAMRSPTFQDAVQKYSGDEVAQHIYAPFLIDGEQTKRPFVCVKADQLSTAPTTAGERNQTLSTGVLVVMMARDLIHGLDQATELLDFVDWSSAIMREMCVCSGENTGYTYAWEWVGEPLRSNPQHVAEQRAQTPYYMVAFAVEWSL